MSDQTYNGWTNYETWAVKLWIDNDQDDYRLWNWRAREALIQEDTQSAAQYRLSEQLQSYFEEHTPVTSRAYSDLMSHALRRVDWGQIAKSLIEDAQQSRNAGEP